MHFGPISAWWCNEGIKIEKLKYLEMRLFTRQSQQNLLDRCRNFNVLHRSLNRSHGARRHLHIIFAAKEKPKAPSFAHAGWAVVLRSASMQKGLSKARTSQWKEKLTRGVNPGQDVFSDESYLKRVPRDVWQRITRSTHILHLGNSVRWYSCFQADGTSRVPWSEREAIKEPMVWLPIAAKAAAF